MQITSIALEGLNQAENQANRAAAWLAGLSAPANPPQDEVSLSDAAVSLLEGRISYQANLNAIKVGDKMEQAALSLIG
jgi:hypothetical protein